MQRSNSVKLLSLRSRARVPQPPKPECPEPCSTRAATSMRSPSTQLEKSRSSNQDPAQPQINTQNDMKGFYPGSPVAPVASFRLSPSGQPGHRWGQVLRGQSSSGQP